MSKQFENVACHYGAPMGRPSKRYDNTLARSVSLFRVNLDNGGYDDGGAYWGHGKPLYCATADCGGREFTRANNRAHAAAILDLSNAVLKRGINRDYIAALFKSYNGIGPALPPSWLAIDHLEYWFADNGFRVSTGGDRIDITPADFYGRLSHFLSDKVQDGYGVLFKNKPRDWQDSFMAGMYAGLVEQAAYVEVMGKYIVPGSGFDGHITLSDVLENWTTTTENVQ